MLFARPWWVNLLVVAPVASYIFWRKKGLSLTRGVLLAAFLFGLAFGFVEASVVVYLRIATGLLPLSSMGSQVAGHASAVQPTARVLAAMPQKLVEIETVREAATLIMLMSLAVLGSRDALGRSALFLWTFATWDIAYYAGLSALIHWPASLRDVDILFLIPVPWIAEVWFPLAVSVLMMMAVMTAGRTRAPENAMKRSDPSIPAEES